MKDIFYPLFAWCHHRLTSVVLLLDDSLDAVDRLDLARDATEAMDEFGRKGEGVHGYLDHGVIKVLGADGVLKVEGEEAILLVLNVGDLSDAHGGAFYGFNPLARLTGRLDLADDDGRALEELKLLANKEAVLVAALVHLYDGGSESFAELLHIISGQEARKFNSVGDDLLGGSSGDASDSKELHLKNIFLIN